jgi:hypothetical protein
VTIAANSPLWQPSQRSVQQCQHVGELAGSRCAWRRRGGQWLVKHVERAGLWRQTGLPVAELAGKVQGLGALGEQ